MKKNSRIKTVLLIVLMALLCVPFSSCTKDNGGGNNMGIEFRMRNEGNSGREIDFDIGCFLGMFSSNNFGVVFGKIATVGKVSSLSRITSIPESGWVDEIAVHPGYGYVIKSEKENSGYKYARVYVEEWIKSTDGGIIGSVLWYEDNWR